MGRGRALGIFRSSSDDSDRPELLITPKRQALASDTDQQADSVVHPMHNLEREAQRAVEQAAARAADILAQAARSERLAITGLTSGAMAAVTSLREETRQLGQKVEQLERTLAKHSTALRELSETMTEQADLLNDHAAQRDKQDELVARTAQTLAQYVETVDTLRARLFIEDRSLTDADFLAHYQIGERLKRLFTQRLPDLTNVRANSGQGSTGGRDVLMQEAQQVRLMCLALFDGEEPDLPRLAAIVTESGQMPLSEQGGRLLERVQHEVTNLRKAIEDTGHPYSFIFQLPAGTVADPDQHELWTSATVGEPVAFVVTPGYLVSGRRILPPAVITVRREARR